MADGRHFKNRYIPYISEKSSDEMLYTAANFELDERHVIKTEKIALYRLRVRQNVFLVFISFRFRYPEKHYPAAEADTASSVLVIRRSVAERSALRRHHTERALIQ